MQKKQTQFSKDSVSHSTIAATLGVLVWLPLTAPAQTDYIDYDFATLAGSPRITGSADGTGSAARFNHPSGLAVDSADNVFVADQQNNTIRKMTPAGVVTTLAGSPGVAGSADGTGSAARFYWPECVAVDSTGNVFVTDTLNHTIRKVTPAGVVTTLAGSPGAAGSADGTGSVARFNHPTGVAVDNVGNLFVGDYGNHTIRQVTPAGVVTTLAGSPGVAGSADGMSSAARFNQPDGVAVDSTGNLFVAEYGNHTIRRVTPAGVVTTLAGSPGVAGSADGMGSAARFYCPKDVALDSADNLFVADIQNHTIRKMTPAGVVTTLAGSPGAWGSADGTGSVARFFQPEGVAVNSAGIVYVGDKNNSTIRMGTEFLVVTTQPQSQTVLVGQSAILWVSVCGPAPAYQWHFNGTKLPEATNSLLAIPSVQLTDAGDYSVVVTNARGSVTSSIAILQVLPPGAPSILVNGELAVGNVIATGFAQMTLSGGFTNGFIFYTLDGSVPTTSSPLYTGPMTVTNSGTIQAMSLSADFSQSAFAPAVKVQIIPTYNLQTAVVGAGTITVGPTNGPYASNTVVVLVANPAVNWAFDHWTGDVTGSENPLSLTMDGPRTVQAVFVQTAYPLTVTTPGGGTVSVDGEVIPPATFYPIGSVVAMTAGATNGWSFLGWQGDANGTNNPLSLTIDQTNNVQGIFGTVVGTNTAGGGRIVLSQPNPIPYGTLLAASAVPDAGNYFVTWSGAASGTNAPTRISVTSSNPTINALFATLPGGKYSMAVVVMGNGSVAISPQKNYYNSGDSVTLSASTTNAGTSFYGWTGDASGTNNPLVVVVNSNTIVQANFGALPTVNVSPQNLIVLAGSNAVLNANAAGLPPLSYQWQNSQGAIAGATNAGYTIFGAQAGDAGSYSVVVSNPFGSVTSGVATVTVVFPPAITQDLQNWTVAAGTVLNLHVSASGTEPLSYQWLNSLGEIAGATNATYTLNPAHTNNADGYFVVVRNPYGAVTSAVATVTVYVPVSITTHPASQVVPARSTVWFGVVAGGYPAPSYQWAFNGTNVPGATASTLSLTNVLLPDMGSYAVLVGNGYSSQLSDTATLSMSPSITSPFIGATTIWGKSAVLSVGAIGSGELVYQWYKDGVAIDGATDATLNFTSTQFTNGGLYLVVVSSLFGSTTNVAAQVVVNPAGVSLSFSPTLTIEGVVGYSYVIDRTADLANTNAWVTLTNLTLAQPVEIWVDTSVDASSPFHPKYFYRVLPGQ